MSAFQHFVKNYQPHICEFVIFFHLFKTTVLHGKKFLLAGAKGFRCIFYVTKQNWPPGSSSIPQFLPLTGHGHSLPSTLNFPAQELGFLSSRHFGSLLPTSLCISLSSLSAYMLSLFFFRSVSLSMATALTPFLCGW